MRFLSSSFTCFSLAKSRFRILLRNTRNLPFFLACPLGQQCLVAAVVHPLWVCKLSWKVALDTCPDAHGCISPPAACPGPSRNPSMSFRPHLGQLPALGHRNCPVVEER